jgi:hypothetical protein
MDEAVPDKIKELIAPQNRLELQRWVESEYEAARKLLRERQYKEALKKFKCVFANDAGYRLFLDNREIINLVKNYAPAGAVIKRWRNDKERLVLEQKADLALIRQWDTLNSWERLALTRRYDVLKDYLDSLGFHLLLHALDYDSDVLFPHHRKMTNSARKDDMQRHVSYLLQEGTLSYEVALGLGEKHIASEFAKKILSVETSDRCYASLIKGAIRARNYPEAKAMFMDAQKHFSLRRLRYCSKAIKAMPKSEFAKLSK